MCKTTPMNMLLIAPPSTRRETIVAALEAHDPFTLRRCASVERALETFAQHPTDAVVLDGAASAAQVADLRREAPALPIIMLTDAPPDEADALAEEDPNVHVIPCSADQLQAPCFPTFLHQLIRHFAAMASSTRQHAQALENERRARALEKALREVSNTLTATLELEQVLDRLLEALLHLIACDAANVMLTDGDDVRICRWRGFGAYDLQEQVKGRRFSLQDTPNLQEAIGRRRPLLIPDAQQYPGWVSYPDTHWIRAHLCAPIFLEDDLVGFLNVDSATPGAFDEGDGEMLAALVPLAAVALRNARLFENERRAREAAQRQVENLETLNDLSLQTSTSQRPDAISRIIVQEILGLTHSDGAAFFHYDPESDRLLQVESAGSATPFQGQPLPPGTWASFQSWTEQEPLIIEDFAAWEERVDYPIADEIHALVAVPVSWQEHKAGVLTAFRHRAGAPYTQSETHLLQLLSQQMAVAIYSAELYQSLRCERDRLLALSDVEQKILDMFENPEEAVRRVLHYALELMNLPKGLIVLSLDDARSPELIYTQGIQDVAHLEALIRKHWGRERAMHAQREPQSYVASDDIARDVSTFAELSARERIGAGLSIPLWIQGQVSGVLALLDEATHGWREEEVRIAQMLAGQASIAMEKALLARRLQERLDEAEMLNRILQAVNATLAPDEILDITCTQMRRSLDAPSVTAGVLRDGYMRIVSEDREDAVPSIQGDIVPVEQSPLLRRTLARRQVTTFEDVTVAPSDAREHLRPRWTRALLLAPLIVGETPGGLLQVAYAAPRAFTQLEIDHVELIIAAITPALENARLFQEVQQARRSTEQALERLQRLDAMKTQFIQNVSHELRTPLTIIKGYIDMVLDTSLGFKMAPTMKQAIQGVQTHTHHLVKIVESITALEDAELGNIELTPQPVMPVLITAVQTVWQRAMRYEMEILLDLPDYLPKVKLDTQPLIRAFHNVLDNAIKFNRRGGKIWVKAWSEDAHVYLQVRDSGIGIPQEELACIFERFYQVDGTASRQYGGMGLGLSIVQEIIQAHGGEVWAESRGPDQGTRLTMKLPIYRPPQPSEERL